ncbi:MAG TPA: DGQHR domain-containing protein, partial [Pyrinomonadaceae bacterium]|nr:DGQHR domain-containing protein [Pyrinomonadaceae bacterium]
MPNGIFQSIPVIQVSQRLGLFYATRLNAETLLALTFADPLRVTSAGYAKDKYYQMTGAQRVENSRRLKAISGFIQTTEAAFPNSIILAANYNEDGEFVDDDQRRWRIESNGDDDCLKLVIPTNERLASVIDGQHRLNAFELVDADLRKTTELLCAIYLDLPNPYQASLFATINFNQKKVDRSLAYLLFGMGLEDEVPSAWAPDKTAVFLSRRLNVEKSSPLHQHILVAAQQSEILFKNKKSTWAVSTATVVDGILRLFSAKPQADKDKMYKVSVEDGRNRETQLEDDGTPLRNLYLKTKDNGIYTILVEYFSAVDEIFWKNAASFDVMTKTIAIQALFDILRLFLAEIRREDGRDFSKDFFLTRLRPAANIDFDSLFESSGRGRTSIRNYIGLKA